MSDANKETFHFELVSPEQKLISEPATMAVVPGEEGEMGVLPNHASVLSTLRPGVIEVHSANDNTAPRRIFVAGGFADISPSNCTILAEYAVNVDDLNQADVERKIRDLTEDMGMAEGLADKTRIERKIALEKAKLTAITGELQL